MNPKNNLVFRTLNDFLAANGTRDAAEWAKQFCDENALKAVIAVWVSFIVRQYGDQKNIESAIFHRNGESLQLLNGDSLTPDFVQQMSSITSVENCREFVKSARGSIGGSATVKLTQPSENIVVLLKSAEIRSPTNEIYWENASQLRLSDCVGLKVGLVLLGADISIAPRELLFPFSKAELDSAVASLRNEADNHRQRHR